MPKWVNGVAGKRCSRHTHRNDPEDIITIENNHPALIDIDTFNKVQDRLNSRAWKMKSPSKANLKYYLSNILYCGYCGNRLTGRKTKSVNIKLTTRYACEDRYKNKTDCPLLPVRKNTIESLVFDDLISHIFSQMDLLAECNKFIDAHDYSRKQQYTRLQVRKEEVETKIEKTINLMLENDSPSLHKMLTTLDDELKNINLSIDSVTIGNYLILEDLEDIESHFKEYLLESLNNHHIKPLLLNHINKITATNDHIDIEYLK